MDSKSTEGVNKKRLLFKLLCLFPIFIYNKLFAIPIDLKEQISLNFNPKNLKKKLVKIKVPRIVESGNIVPITININTKISSNNFVDRISIYSEKNFEFKIIDIFLNEKYIYPEISTRIRLLESQKVYAIVKFNDGKLFYDYADVEVISSSCG